jgi:Cof subfamily protein (haloacid dehalogenase superfamily)
VSSRTVTAIRAVQQKGIRFIVATGKSRGGVRIALGKLGEELTSGSATGGVYLQGLIVYKGGEVVYERTLEAAVALDVMAFAREKGVSLIAFNGDRILCEKMDESIASVTAQHEPMPEVVPLEDFISSSSSSTNRIHKLILLAPPSVISSIRPSLASYLGPRTTLTQAQGDMLEVLPPGGSKGLGVQKLLEALEVDKANILAIGDQENDLEMLKMAGTAVAMGNAPLHVKTVAGFQTRSNDEDGAAMAFERFCLDVK